MAFTQPGTFPTAADLADDDLNTKKHSDLHGTLGDAAVTLDTMIRTGWCLPAVLASATATYVSAPIASSSIKCGEATITTAADWSAQIKAGDKFRCNHNGTLKYFIVTKVATTTLTLLSPNTAVVAQSDLSATGTITACYFSKMKNPLGFISIHPADWTTSASDASSASTASATYVNTSGLTIKVPIGAWQIGYTAELQGTRATATTVTVRCGLSTTSTGTPVDDMLCDVATAGASATLIPRSNQSKRAYRLLSADTDQYLVQAAIAADTVALRGDLADSLIWATCAYL